MSGSLSIAEHHELDELLAELEDMDMASPGWLQRFKALKDKMLHHFEDEEQGFFQHAGNIFDAQQKSHLGKAYRDKMSQQGL